MHFQKNPFVFPYILILLFNKSSEDNPRLYHEDVTFAGSIPKWTGADPRV